MPTLTTLTTSALAHLTTPTPFHTNPHHPITNQDKDNDSTQNVIFGVFAIVLALIGILLAWLQIRHYKQRRQDEEHIEMVEPPPMVQVVEMYTFTRQKTLRLLKHATAQKGPELRDVVIEET